MLEKLRKKWERVPDWRMGQLLINIGMVPDSVGLFYTEDDTMEQIIDAAFCKHKNTDIQMKGSENDGRYCTDCGITMVEEE